MATSLADFASIIGKLVKSFMVPVSVLFLLFKGQTIAKHGSALTRMKCTNSAIALA